MITGHTRRSATVSKPVTIKTLLLVEDDEMLRQDLVALFVAPPLGCEVTACSRVATAQRAIDSGARFDVALIDLGLPDGRGIDIIRHLHERQGACPAVVFTVFEDSESLFDALRAGACGYILKQTPLSRIHAALLEAMAGGAPMSPSIARRVVMSFAPKEGPESSLSKREREILTLLAGGHTYSDIANALEIGLGTVQSYVKTIYAKLQISSKAEAAAIAVRLGLI